MRMSKKRQTWAGLWFSENGIWHRAARFTVYKQLCENLTGVTGCAPWVLKIQDESQTHSQQNFFGVVFPTVQCSGPELAEHLVGGMAGSSVWNSSPLFPCSFLLFHHQLESSSPGSLQ